MKKKEERKREEEEERRMRQEMKEGLKAGSVQVLQRLSFSFFPFVFFFSSL